LVSLVMTMMMGGRDLRAISVQSPRDLRAISARSPRDLA